MVVAAFIRRVGLQIASGLSFLHFRLGLMHCDVKPENVLLCSQGAKLCDFGAWGESGE